MKTVKLQHYVPQFYLKKFGHKLNDKNYWVYCFDKTNSEVKRINTKRIGAENYFYDVSNTSVPQYEELFKHFETRFSVLFKKIIKYQQIDSLSHNERIIISVFVALQEVRTREFRERLRSQVSGLYDALMSRGLEMNPNLKAEIEDSMTDESIKNWHLRMISDTPEFATYIYSMKWILLYNKLDIPFWASDNPVVRFNPIDHGLYGNLGYLSTGIRLHYPFTPQLTIVFCDPFQYVHQPTYNEVKLTDNVDFENSLQVIQSTRHLFSISPDFSLADKILSENPTLREIDRKRHNIQ